MNYLLIRQTIYRVTLGHFSLAFSVFKEREGVVSRKCAHSARECAKSPNSTKDSFGALFPVLGALQHSMILCHERSKSMQKVAHFAGAAVGLQISKRKAA